MNKDKQSSTFNIVLLVIFSIIGVLFLLSLLNNNVKKEGGVQTITTTKFQKEDISSNSLSISKERFDYYNQAFLNLNKLQDEYEQIYIKFGMVDFEEAKKIPEYADFPEYGSIKRKISSVHNSAPKYNSELSPGEKYLLFRLTAYSSSLIFLTPREDDIEGIDFASGKKKIIKDALKEVKNFNRF